MKTVAFSLVFWLLSMSGQGLLVEDLQSTKEAGDSVAPLEAPRQEVCPVSDMRHHISHLPIIFCVQVALL
jgi:hypothetical protein